MVKRDLVPGVTQVCEDQGTTKSGLLKTKRFALIFGVYSHVESSLVMQVHHVQAYQAYV